MSKKIKISITVWTVSNRIWVANKLSALHIDFTSEDFISFTEYRMKVSEKQLSNIIVYIVPEVGDIRVEMILNTGVIVRLTH